MVLRKIQHALEISGSKELTTTLLCHPINNLYERPWAKFMKQMHKHVTIKFKISFSPLQNSNVMFPYYVFQFKDLSVDPSNIEYLFDYN